MRPYSVFLKSPSKFRSSSGSNCALRQQLCNRKVWWKRLAVCIADVWLLVGCRSSYLVGRCRWFFRRVGWGVRWRCIGGGIGRRGWSLFRGGRICGGTSFRLKIYRKRYLAFSQKFGFFRSFALLCFSFCFHLLKNTHLQAAWTFFIPSFLKSFKSSSRLFIASRQLFWNWSRLN